MRLVIGARLAVTAALLGVVAALVLGLWPLRGPGIHGSAITPHLSHEFGFYTYSTVPLPEHPTNAQLRAAGLVLPQDRLATRRRETATTAAVSLIVLVVASSVLVRRGPRDRRRSRLT
jgi:hypothetical protein